MAKFKQSKLQTNLEKLNTQLNSYKSHYQELQSYKDNFSQIQTDENTYLSSESQILKSSISKCESTIKEVTGDNFRVSNIFLQEGEVEEMSDSLQFLNKLKRSLTKTWEFVEDFNEGINEKASKIVGKYEERLKKVQGKIEKSERVLKDLEGEGKEIEKGIEDLIRKVKDSEENLNKKKAYCQGNRDKIEKEIERKGKQLETVKKVVEEYEEDSEGTLKKLRGGEY
jgi:chromosome segregation ATPase